MYWLHKYSTIHPPPPWDNTWLEPPFCCNFSCRFTGICLLDSHIWILIVLPICLGKIAKDLSNCLEVDDEQQFSSLAPNSHLHVLTHWGCWF